MLAAVARAPARPDGNKRAGELLALARRDDVIDAHIMRSTPE
jgi:hypothetical protein